MLKRGTQVEQEMRRMTMALETRGGGFGGQRQERQGVCNNYPGMALPDNC